MQQAVIFDNHKSKNKDEQLNSSDKILKMQDSISADQKEESQESGVKDAIKETVKEEIKNEHLSKIKMATLAKKAGDKVFEVSTIFPLDLFPDKLIVETDRLNIYFKEFIGTGQIKSIPLENVADVTLESSPIFSTLRIFDKTLGPEDQLVFSPIKKDQGRKARRIIIGLMMAAQHGVELNSFDPKELAKKAEEIGQTQDPYD